jgi:hypothetical protein
MSEDSHNPITGPHGLYTKEPGSLQYLANSTSSTNSDRTVNKSSGRCSAGDASGNLKRTMIRTFQALVQSILH